MFRFAVATVVLASFLIFVGGSVTSLDAGMAYPDAPLSNGALINPPGWLKQVKTFWEHKHRLVGWGVGLCAVATVVAGFVSERRSWVRLASIGSLFLIVSQGILGIFRVRYDSVAMAMGHGVLGQVTFTWLVCAAMFSSPSWARRLPPARSEEAAWRARWSRWLVVVLGVQLLLGAGVRHFGSFGLLIVHIWWGTMAAVIALRVTMRVLGEVADGRGLRRAASILGAATVAQVLLGVGAFAVTGGSSALIESATLSQWIVPTLHVLTGAVVLASAGAVCALCQAGTVADCRVVPQDAATAA
ncbi:MAG: Heme A synthase [Phycisphaerae bacterium]|nr:Heme A synthase [Phycisphaerae bacterium]